MYILYTKHKCTLSELFDGLEMILHSYSIVYDILVSQRLVTRVTFTVVSTCFCTYLIIDKTQFYFSGRYVEVFCVLPIVDCKNYCKSTYTGIGNRCEYNNVIV